MVDQEDYYAGYNKGSVRQYVIEQTATVPTEIHELSPESLEDRRMHVGEDPKSSLITYKEYLNILKDLHISFPIFFCGNP